MEGNKLRYGMFGSDYSSNIDFFGILYREIRVCCCIVCIVDVFSIWKERVDKIDRVFLRKELFSH